MAETRLEVIYSVTSTTYTTQLFNVTGNFVKAELADDTELPASIFNQENKAYLFDQTGLTSVFYTLCGNTLVGEEFQGMTRIVGVNVPSTVTSIPERCFRNCTNLSDVYITSSVTSIASGAFENTAIEFFEIPATSVTIGDRVFAGCSALTAITMNAPTAPSVSQYTFYQVHTGGTLTYPSGSDYSSWLSNNEYYLGYYGWTGDTPTPDPPGLYMVLYFTQNGEGYISTSITSGSQSVCLNTKVQNLSGDVSAITISVIDTDASQVYIDNYPVQDAAPEPSYNYTFPVTAGETGTICISIPENHYAYEKRFEYIIFFEGEMGKYGGSSPTQISDTLSIEIFQSAGTPPHITPRPSFTQTGVTISSGSQTVNATFQIGQNTECCTGIGYATLVSSSVTPSGAINPIPAPSVSSITVADGQTSQISFPIPANTGAQRTIDYTFSVTFEEDCAACGGESSTETWPLHYVITQSGAPVAKDIAIYPQYMTAQSADTTIYCDILTSGCVFSSFTITERGGDVFSSGPQIASGGIRLKFEFPENTGATRRETYAMQLFDTEGNAYSTFLTLTQEPKGSSGNQPLPWDNTGDTAYTWYTDDSLLRILPASKILAASETIGYWPVTAHSFNNVEVRTSGDVVFTYELSAETNPDYNSHSLYAYTEDNTGLTQQVSTIKLVAFSGTSAYSASTVLMKNPDSHGWITASPNPVNVASLQNSVNVYLTLTSCQRNINKETTDNVEFDEATWVTVTRVNNTTLTFNFQANNSQQTRSTYYYAYALDNSGNNVYCRIDITQEADSMGITITPDRTSLGKPAGSFTARVESTENGNFSFSASSWMVVRSYVPESQYGGTLYVDYYENNNEWPRTGDIIATQQISTAPYTLSAKTQISQTNTADTAYIRVTPSSISVDRTAGVVEAQVSYAGLATVPALVQNEGNMSIVSYNLDSGLITVAYGANDTSMDKYKNFTVTAMSSNGNVIEANFTITQGGTGLPVAPIWRDYVLTLPTPGQGYINYNVSYDGTVVYTGRAYGMGQDNIEIYYNHLCKPFLSNHIDFTEGYQSIRDWLGNFIITSPELGDITSVSFYEDYSYVNRDIANVMSLNNPIINEVVEGSYVPFSFFITGASGNVSIMQNGQQITGLTVNDNEQHRYFVEAENGKTYSSLGAVYKTIPVCSARYSLYYVNSFGGVDVLPFKGKSFKKTDNITRLNYSRSFRNNTLEFENVNYMNEMKPVWELNTSYMVDSQSRKMHELVESTCVYLYDAEEQTYTPVVMTDKKLEYKTFYNQGRRFYTYTINVEESQSRERR